MQNERPAVKTPVTATQLKAALAATLPVNEQPAIPILLAQMALESGALKTATGERIFASSVNYNFGGIKCNSVDVPHHYTTTLELVNRAAAKKELQDGRVELAKDSGANAVLLRYKPNHPTCRFKSFDTLEDGVRAQVDLLRRRFGPAYAAAVTGDPVLFVHELKARGYFTSSEDDYRKNVVSLTKEFMATPLKSVDTEIQETLVKCGEIVSVDGNLGPKSKQAILSALRRLLSMVQNGLSNIVTPK